MNTIPLKTPRLTKKPIKFILDKIKSENIPIKNGDVFVFTSKIVSYDENQLIKLTNVKCIDRAKKLSKKYDLDPHFTQLIIDESDEIIGGCKKAILTLKNGILIANAGADLSNVPKRYASIWPKSPALSADRIKKLIYKKFGKKVGIIISDSHCLPSRHGTTGMAIAIAGFKGIISEIGESDLFDKPLQITYHNIADELAGISNFLMGESSQKIPAVIIKDANIKLSNKKSQDLTNDLLINKDEDLFNKLYK